MLIIRKTSGDKPYEVVNDKTGRVLEAFEHESVALMCLHNHRDWFRNHKREYCYRGWAKTDFNTGRNSTIAIYGLDLYGEYGILEWCLNEEDAKNILDKMQKSGEFKDLRIVN